MQRLLRSVGLFLVLLAITNLAIAQKAPQPVVVTNTASQPVPTVAQGTTTVSGSVSVTNTPSVNVANTPSVNINSMPAVALGSGATVAVDPSTTVNTANAAARNIVRLSAYRYCPGACTGYATSRNSYPNSYFVPAGKRLVINNVSMAAQVPSGQQPLLEIHFRGPGTSMFVLYPEWHKTATVGSIDLYVYNGTAPIYADPGGFGAIELVVSDPSGGTGTDYVWTFFQGYLVDCGSGCTQE